MRYLLAICAALFAALQFASAPSLKAQSDINLSGYTLAFNDDFNTLSATTSSPKGASNWYALPAYGSAGYFSASNWNISAFSVSGGILSDTAYWANPAVGGQNWQSGILSSVDTTKAGFSQTYGYFEIRCQMPNAGSGAWPSFWLDSLSGISAQQNEEIDVFEWYGVCNTPGSYQAVMQQASHNWNSDGSQNQTAPYLYVPQTPMPGGTYPWLGYHIYGVQIDLVHVTWYIDGVQTNQIATPTAYINTAFYMMVDYALGGGWPVNGDPYPSHGSSALLVDWVRVYNLPSGGSAPAAPTSLTASAGNAQVALSWTASSGATSYNVYRGTTAGGENATPVVTGVTGTTYTNTGLSNGTAYYFKVAAVNASGTSGYSNEATATPTAGGGGGGSAAFANASFETPSVGDYTYSSTGASWTFVNNAGVQHNGSAYSGSTTVAPDGVQTGFVQGASGTLGSMTQSVTFTAGTYTLSFQAAQRYGQVQPLRVSVDGTTVGTYSAASNSFAPITTAAFTVAAGSHSVALAATDSSADKTIFVDLVTIAASGGGGGSAPAAPTGLSASAGSAQVTLNWTAASGATSYNVYRATSAGGEGATPVVTGITGTTYTNTGLGNGTAYYFKVAAVNSYGTSGYSNEASATPTSGIPAAPTGLGAMAGSAQVTLNWTAASGATSYNVYRGTTAGGENATPVVTGVTGTTYTNTGLSNGTAYYFKVAAVNASGTSGYSNEASATPTAGGGGNNVFANASFETPPVSGYTYSSTGASWTFVNNAGIQQNGSAYSGSGPVAPGGVQSGLLQGTNGLLGSMAQSVNFTAGSHTISFMAAQRYGQVQPIKVSVDGTVVGTYTPASSNYASITTAAFTVAAGAHTVTFAATDNSADKTSFIDLVSVN